MTSEATGLDLIAVTAFGLEAVAVRELHDLGMLDAKAGDTGRIAFRGTLTDVARANLWLRSAERVLIRVGSFPAPDFDALFEGVKGLAWESLLERDAAFTVSARSVRSALSSEPALQRSTKRAIADRLLSAHRVHDLPETGAPYSIEVSILRDVATLTIDTTGPGLNKRGYRDLVGEAQLRETMAAALVLLSFWKPNKPMIDPFCGTGTIPIEAALIGRNCAPGLHRAFDFEAWPFTPAGLMHDLREHARAQRTPPLTQRIIATDLSEDALEMARHHAQRAGVEGDIHFQQRDFADLRSKADFGCLVTNPPYGQRIGDLADLRRLYASFPEVLSRLPTWSHFILTSYPGFESLVGRAADRRRKLFNASIEVTYYQFHGPRPPRDETPAANDVADAKPAFGGLDARADRQAEMFATVLAKHARHLRRWPDRGVSCYRLYERDIPEVPLVVDLYEGRLHMAEYERPHDRDAGQHAEWLELMVRTASAALGIDRRHAYFKKRGRQRGSQQYERVSEKSHTFTVCEQGLKFEVNLTDYVDTGLFLDHRITRSMVRERSRGVRFLNLFAYTGAFTVYAAAGGAAQTTTVDLSSTYLDWAERNLLLNGFDAPIHELVQADARAYLASLPAQRRFDLAVVDPPTFSNSKRTDDDFDIQLDHRPLLESLHRRMVPGGFVYFSTNFRKFRADLPPCFEAREISAKTVPEDFRNRKIHRCWLLKVL
jgi:23S rRNA (guanine2445-N2)-methyltransferase / 23S rRNA (guanine2069-N7)-methyltransferase